MIACRRHTLPWQVAVTLMLYLPWLASMTSQNYSPKRGLWKIRTSSVYIMVVV